MLAEPKYEVSRDVAKAIEDHFSQHLKSARDSGAQELAPAPEAAIIANLINASFWASLGKEEGHSPRISLALLPPDTLNQSLIFQSSVPLTASNLLKLSPGVENPGIHLGVWFENGQLCIWGTTTSIPGVCFVLQVLEPGLLIIKHRRLSGFGKFVNVAVLTGDQVKIIDEDSSSLADCPALLTSLMGMPVPSFLNDSVNVLVELAISMRMHGRGGLLLIVPDRNSSWRNSIIHPINHLIDPPYIGITSLMEDDAANRDNLVWQQKFKRQVHFIGGFTAVDGATIITRNHEMLAFGAKVTRASENGHVDKIITTEPIVGGQARVIHPAQNGGTRHLAAAQFVYDQRETLALVASQDGKFTVFAWSDQLNMVHAHRIDILLL